MQTEIQDMSRRIMLDYVVTVMRAAEAAITIESIKANGLVPDDFFSGDAKADQRELNAAIKRIDAETAAAMADEVTEPPQPDADDGEFTEIAEQPQTVFDHDLAAPAVVEPEQPPEISLLEATNEIARVRAEKQMSLQRIAKARHRVAECLRTLQYLYGGAPSPEQLRKEFAADENAKRGKIASGEIEPTRMARRANTQLDQSLGRGGSADDHVRSRMRTGHRRGAMPSQMQGGYDRSADQRLQPKLPSTR